ncbi:TetR/AcrR family transcriptional regulator [Salipaludibacillus sp. HK11]|uniref:TetR/AcrR family transcriptional regulator n=1 Tax=Salipaludibacillus sp. HK11 TaxID=3394320 RepID=UPI0039FC8FE6
MRVIKDPEERRNEIMDVAERLFLTKGYTGTAINDILKEIGIAKGTFYYYFQSKEEVMDAIVMRFIKKGVEAATCVANDTNLTAPEKLFHILMSQNQGDDEKMQMVDQLHHVNNAEMHQKSLVESIVQLTPVLTQVIEQGMEEGVFETDYPQESVEFLLVASQFLFDEGIFQWKPEQLIKKAVAFTNIMEKSLGAKQGTFSYIVQLISDSTQRGDDSSE